jgi:hypothetical protein
MEVGEYRVRVFYGTEKREKEKDSRYIQKASAPAAGPCIRPVTSCTSVTLPPLAALHETKSSKNFRTKKATDEGPIWPADSRDAGNSPETYTIPRNTKITMSRVKSGQCSTKIKQPLLVGTQ